MAVNPVSQPLAPGLLEVDYSPWDAAAAARSGAPAGLLSAPAIPAYQAPQFTGGSRFGNYVRAYPDLLANFMADAGTPYPSIQDFGRHHWEQYGSGEGRTLPQANPAISLGDTMDVFGEGSLKYSAGLPMPEVEGYKYVYPAWEWSEEDSRYTKLGATYENIDEYPYFPYMPYGEGEAVVDGVGQHRILVGVELIKE